MSVPKSQRREAQASFVRDIRMVRIRILRLLKKFPSGWHRSVTDSIADMAASAFRDIMQANSVRITNSSVESDYLLRHDAFERACATLSALAIELTFCNELVRAGNNFFTSKQQSDSMLMQCVKICYNCRDKVRKVISNDRCKWKKIVDERARTASADCPF